MQTWTYNLDGVTAVVSADNVELACLMLEERFKAAGSSRAVNNVHLVPLPTHHRYVRVLTATGLAKCDHEYVDCSTAGPDTGNADHKCKKCGHYVSVPLY